MWETTQEAISCWGNLFCLTGRALKPEKSFWYLVDFEWDKGEWKYTQLVDGFELYIPLPDSTKEEIERIDVTVAKKTLGVLLSPSSDYSAHLDVLGQKINQWADRVKNGQLASHLMWMRFWQQLWSSLRYGVGILSAPHAALDGELDGSYRKLLPLLGINKNIWKEWRKMSSDFLGVGLPATYKLR